VKHQATTGQYCISRPPYLFTTYPGAQSASVVRWSPPSRASSGQGPAPDLTPHDCQLANIIIDGIYMPLRGVHGEALKDDTPSLAGVAFGKGHLGLDL
jgi:hypothetical protein